jgi:hypothetical protein
MNSSFTTGVANAAGAAFVSTKDRLSEGMELFAHLIHNTTHVVVSGASRKLESIDKEDIYNEVSQVVDMVLYYLRIMGATLFHYASIFWGIAGASRFLREENLSKVAESLVVMKTHVKLAVFEVANSKAGSYIVALGRSIIATVSAHEFQRFALSITLTLAFGAWLWGLSTGVILGKIFRRPLKTMGVEYRSMSFSPLRLSITVTDIVAYPTSCSILQTILLAILPSSDVTTSPPTKEDKTVDGEASSRMGSPSKITIEFLCVRPSFRLWWARPLTLLWTLPSSTSKNAKASNKNDNKQSTSGTRRSSNTHQQGERKPKHHQWINSLVRHVSICGPAPMLFVECRRLRVEVDKVYLGPMVLDGLVFNGELSNLPGSVRAMLLAKRDDPNLTLPAFFAKKTPKLASFRADGATFNLERWLEQSQKAQQKNKKEEDSKRQQQRRKQHSSSRRTGTRRYNLETSSPTHAQEHVDVSTYDEETSSHQSTRQDSSSDASSLFEVGNDEKTPNALLQTTFRILLSAFQFKAHEIEYVVRGASASSVREIRKQLPPDQACLALSRMSRKARAVTVVGVRDFSLSFHGYNSDLIMATEGLYIRVGSPVPPRRPSSPRSSRGAPLDFQKKRRKRSKRTAPQIRDVEWYRTWTDVVSPSDCIIHIGGILDVAVWLFGYDFFWFRKSLSLSLTVIDQTLNVDPEPLHTLLVHFDDWIDGNAPINEWQAWFIKETKCNALTLDELNIYRACYKMARLGKKGKQDHTNEENANRGDDNNAIYNYLIETSGAGTSMPAEGGDPQEILSKLEQRMEFQQIMAERRRVMGPAWSVPRNNSELDYFMHASGRHQVPTDGKNHVSSHASSLASSASANIGGSSIIDFQDHSSDIFLYEALLALVETKASIMACRLSLIILLPTYKVLVTDKDSRTLDPHSRSHPNNRSHPAPLPTLLTAQGCQTMYASKSKFLPYRTYVGSTGDRNADTKDSAFMQLHLSAELVRWGATPDQATSNRSDVPRFLSNGTLCGLLYEVS